MQNTLRALALMMAVLIAAFSLGCGGDDDEESDPVAENVTATPPAGSEVAGNATIALAFDQPVESDRKSTRLNSSHW